MARRKRVLVTGQRTGSLVSALAVAQNIDVAAEDAPGVDLIVLEASTPDEVRSRINGAPRAMLVVVPRRLREAETKAFRDAGASCVLDADACILDVAFAMSDLLFETIAELRRYGRHFGGLALRFWPLEGGRRSGATAHGHLLGFARSGSFIHTPHVLDEGTSLEMELELAGRRLPIRGRVAYGAEDGLAVEFALDDHEVAPELRAVCSGERSDLPSIPVG